MRIMAEKKEPKASFAVINVSADVMEVFSMTGLNKKLDIRGKQEG